MAEALPLADDRLALLFAFFVELIHVLHRAPVGDMAHYGFPERPVEHAAARQQADRAFVQGQDWPASQPLLLADQNAPRALHRCRTLQGVLDGVKWQADVIDGRWW